LTQGVPEHQTNGVWPAYTATGANGYLENA